MIDQAAVFGATFLSDMGPNLEMLKPIALLAVVANAILLGAIYVGVRNVLRRFVSRRRTGL